jgi:hypothetical protein
MMRRLVRGVAAVGLLLCVGACDGEDEPVDTGSTTSTAPAAETSTTTAAPPTSIATTATTQPAYGSACAPGSHPDCIDPDGDGRHEYLKEGAKCMATLGDTGLCSDLDGDGVAGYPDSG